ncbi:MAG: CehA/McbA family metallohydrolase [Opitutaceae bacterium]|nr:CehA/McbA family metallohydrolase [Cephaloticoccus sp.]MCP5530422.1 CehA/McbA family metallohydrolase [Opitutaceae bacterium]
MILRRPGIVTLLLSLLSSTWGWTAEVPVIPEVEGQPLAANVSRLMRAFDESGTPFPVSGILRQALVRHDARAIQRELDKRVFFHVQINPESRVKVMRGPANVMLHQGGFTPVIVKIHNEAAVTSRLRLTSPQAGKVYAGSKPHILERQRQAYLLKNENIDHRIDRFLSVEMDVRQPMTTHLSGLEVEYAIALIASSEAGKREATIAFDVGEGTQDLGFRAEVPVLFAIAPAIPVRLRIRDVDGAPTMARLVVTDREGRVHPAQAKRLAPDMFFQRQVYRADGETLELPPGDYTVEYGRGPEYRVRRKRLTVPGNANAPVVLTLDLERWINPGQFGFYSGDHHIHAAGCSHYSHPTEGIGPADIFRHVKGEALNVGCVLTWGPGFAHQREFFSAHADALSEPFTVMKYDLEISGFGSWRLGHVVLLNLRDQTYPGSEGRSDIGWPGWTVPVMRWAKEQGGYTGCPHSASGMAVEPEAEAERLLAANDDNQDGRLAPEEAADALLPYDWDVIDRDRDGNLTKRELAAALDRAADELPNLAIPGMNGGGAIEIPVSAALGVCDFISAMNTDRIQEWNTWYHLLNCGLPIAVSGETDFPCMSGTRVGQGRVYVRLGEQTSLDYGEWCAGLAAGRSYVSDGYAHALEFTVAGQRPDKTSAVELAAPGTVTVAATVAFASEIPVGVPYGTEMPSEGRRAVGDTVKQRFSPTETFTPGGTRTVEIIVNGRVVATREVAADGRAHDLAFAIPITQSSWVALRQFPELHTNPVRVLVGGRPIRASAQSAQWCIELIKKVHETRGDMIPKNERADAHRAYAKAIAIYEKIRDEAIRSSFQ